MTSALKKVVLTKPEVSLSYTQTMAPSQRLPSHSTSPSDSEAESSDFPQPAPKRRKLSTDDEHDVANAPPTSHSVPSRIRKDQSSTKPKLPTTIDISTTSTTFNVLGVAPWLVHSLRSMAITNPTEIQRSCIPEILKGRDCVGGSRTGTGKTVAFAVPILQQWSKDPFGTYAVILTPTRELALQIYEQFLALGTPQGLKCALITGGSDMREQATALSKRPHIVVATPGRLADHVLTSGNESTAGLTRAKVVVLDEADRLLASGPGSMLPDLGTCLSHLPSSKHRLTLLFTATVTPEVRALKSLTRPADRPPLFFSEVADPASAPTSTSRLPSTLKQTYIQAPITQKDSFLHVLLLVSSLTTPIPPSTTSPSVIIFVNRTATADILARTLTMLEHPVTSLHSQLPQSQRNANLESFRAAKNRILIATDVASRGLDIPDVQYVINYDLPRNPADYVHRVGRTARAGKQGTSISFVTQRDVELVLAIEDYIGGGDNGKMVQWEKEGVNLQTRVARGRTLKDIGEARMEAMREVEQGRDQSGRRTNKLKKDRKRERS